MPMSAKTGIIVLIAVTGVVFTACRQSEQSSGNQERDTTKSQTALKEEPKEKEHEPVIDPPLPSQDISYEEYALNPQTPRSVLSQEGSEIYIPQNAFLDSAGNIVKSTVNLKYREFNNPMEIFMAGVPMEYDTAGKEKVFETAGMIDIRARSNGNPVFVNPDNKIKVRLNSFTASREFNAYSLDTSSGEWQYQGQDKIRRKSYAKESKQLPEVPEPPEKASGYQVFALNVDTFDIPEFAAYDTMFFEPVNTFNPFFEIYFVHEGYNIQTDSNIIRVATDIKINPIQEGKFNITFYYQKDSVRFYRENDLEDADINEKKECVCYPVFKEGVNYGKAMKAYREKHGDVLERRKRKRERLEAQREQYRQKLDKMTKFIEGADTMDLKTSEIRETLKRWKERKEKAERIIRELDVTTFGYKNIDKPVNYPQGAKLVADYRNKNGDTLKLSQVNLIELGRNALYRYNKGESIRVNPERNNILWGITREGHLAYAKPGQLKSIQKQTGTYTFNMNVYKDELKSSEQITSLLLSD